MFAIQQNNFYFRKPTQTLTPTEGYAKLFASVDEAEQWFKETWGPGSKYKLFFPDIPIYIVEVETKVIMHKVLKTVKQL